MWVEPLNLALWFCPKNLMVDSSMCLPFVPARKLPALVPDHNFSFDSDNHGIPINLRERYAKGSPRHPCLPPPNEMYENAPATLSSSLPTANRSGSYLFGSLKM
ncbi:hypothetical protein Lal_00011180 [Lupinus albus]|nr:hypothetical protein Lal_00011180 [Lupinus albus]